MSQNTNEGFDPMDPIGTWRTIRDANLDAWAKSMASFTNTDTFAQMIGAQLDTMLAASAPLQQTVQRAMEQYLAQAQMPSRNEVVSLADRLTNIEMRLDDMQAALDDIRAGVQQPQPAAPATADLQIAVAELKALRNDLQPATPAAAPAELQAALDEIRATLKHLAAAPAAPAAQPAPRRTRKSSETA